ncbi:hypothetical protein NLJ89_g4814 [Agrocybe chaxingu]|uniref:Uncharacterized protein n=1 Tax=Agrocybe chaxingu TaxID=84603 RepID=A0A9W8MXE8_9AGAR|nr:hypothetical protein NLJ89_g4814 [Agrocybe chaxingu]
MARYCGENVAFNLDSHYPPSKLTQLKEADDFRPRISFAYDDDENDTVSTIDFDTFSVAVTEVEDKKGIFAKICTAISKKIGSFGSFVLSCQICPLAKRH